MNEKFDWIAEVRVPADDNKYRVSTGVPLSRCYILTTGHGIPKSDEDKVELRFVHDNFHNNCEWRKASVVWRGEPHDLDAVLLEIDEVKDLISFFYTDRLPEGDATEWSGVGFPAADKVDKGIFKGQRKSKGFGGTYYRGGNRITNELDLQVTGGFIETSEWAGISGSPVMCYGKMIGIVKNGKKEAGGSHFTGIPMWLLLEEDKQLRMILGFGESEDKLAYAKKRAEQLLEETPEIMDALLERDALLGISKSPHQVIKKLFSMEIDVFTDIVRWTFKSKYIYKQAYQERLEQLLNLVLPYLFDHATIISSRQVISGSVFISLPVKTRTVAEILMAAVDGGPSSFRKPVTGDKSHPVGELLIEFMPEHGATLSIDARIASFENMLKDMCLSEDDKNMDLPIEEVRGLINDELKSKGRIAEHDQRLHYYIYNDPDNESTQKFISTLKKYYDQIIFISLGGGSIVQERRWSRPLRDIYKENKWRKK